MKVIYYILFLSALFHYHLIYGQETDYNKKVTELINRQDWSAANEVMQNHIGRVFQLHIMSDNTHIYPFTMPFSFYLSSYILSLQLSYNTA